MDYGFKKQEVITSMAVEEKIKKIIAEQLGVEEDEVVPEASFVEDLGADQILHVLGRVVGKLLPINGPAPRGELLRQAL